ncbi:sensor histidine kinase [Algoriphagus antarcticus]|uniref:Histidine kinase n=1 Tax=Algoriphagus antarcticus TaxID=238540 RepID=A0A3E0D6F2_9BACT|nr:histidine kinase [Algoriphagus antarcticus]REG78236.1 histidine kinase [Algoriphagus antarcticus]
MNGYLLFDIFLQSEVSDLTPPINAELIDSQIRKALLFGLFPVVIAFSFIVFVIYRSKRETLFKQKEIQLRLSIAEGELKALRAQINPHFIFNCLNSIHHFIQTKDSQVAGSYLIKFSQLVRYVLESSAKRMVDMQEEIENNKIYLQLEQMRVNSSFDFHFELAQELIGRDIQIPPMFIQPFLENAVWHGLSEGGKLNVYFSEFDQDHLCCKIRDDGKSDQVKESYDLSNVIKKTSMGVHLMKERFDFYNELNKTKASFSFNENQENGMGREVRILIPYED